MADVVRQLLRAPGATAGVTLSMSFLPGWTDYKTPSQNKPLPGVLSQQK